MATGYFPASSQIAALNDEMLPAAAAAAAGAKALMIALAARYTSRARCLDGDNQRVMHLPNGVGAVESLSLTTCRGRPSSSSARMREGGT